MSMANLLLEFAQNIKGRRVFFTKELLHLGKRSAVDQALYRLVKAQRIRRLARGVFCLNDPSLPLPSLLEIALIKAKAFGRMIAIHGRDALADLHGQFEGNKEITFATNGKSSSFLACGRRIYFKGTTMNRVRAGDGKPGQLIRALAELRSQDRKPKIVAPMLETMSRSDLLDLRRLMPALMTSWMIELIFHSGIDFGIKSRT